MPNFGTVHNPPGHVPVALFKVSMMFASFFIPRSDVLSSRCRGRFAVHWSVGLHRVPHKFEFGLVASFCHWKQLDILVVGGISTSPYQRYDSYWFSIASCHGHWVQVLFFFLVFLAL